MMKKQRLGLMALVVGAFCVPGIAAEPPPKRDAFFWLGEINKASIVINSQEGLLDPALAPKIAAGLATVLEAGAKPGGKRPASVISFEPLLIQAAGVEATLIHAGRSSQDMHATYRAAILRERILTLADQLNHASAAMLHLAEVNRDTIVPNYTNGVAAQPNSYGHYLLGFLAGFERDAARLRETYARFDRSPMGTTVLNGTGWPLDRRRMAAYLGFPALVDNAYDASQISSAEEPVELGGDLTLIALHVGTFIQDVMVQYAQTRPWILLEEGHGNTYVSSAMPQKRNPGLLNDTRSDASQLIGLAMARVMQAHNIPPGMVDPKSVEQNGEMMEAANKVLARYERVLNALVIYPDRALDELNSDWTASQEIADTLMRTYHLPFRVGHHFASTMVEYARANNIRPSNFPYQQAQRLYAETVQHEMPGADTVLPLTEADFRKALDPTAIVNDRATSGGPQPAEMTRMLAEAKTALQAQQTWIADRRAVIDQALAKVDSDFAALLVKK